MWSGWRANAAPTPADAVAAFEWYADHQTYLPVATVDDGMVAAIADDYFAPFEVDPPDDDPNLARSSKALELILELVRSDPDQGWALIVALADRAPDQDGVELLGAGPVEDFVREHGEAYLDQIDEAATQSPKRRSALTYTYGWDKQPKSVRERLSRHFPNGDLDGPPFRVTFTDAD